TTMPQQSSLSVLLTELKRRRVFRVAAVYGGVAFVVVQIVDGAFGYLRIPEWIGSLIIILLLIGFPLAVGLAWVFDITPEGIVRTGRPSNKPGEEVSTPSGTGKLLTSNRALIVIAVLAVAFGVWSRWGGGGDALPDKSIAVLPFVNYSEVRDTEWFSDGVTEEIISQLSKISDLRVISSTSSMLYKGTGKSGKEIGDELGVAHLLEGNVRRAGDRVRIAAQLIDARTDAHLWSDEYDRVIGDIFDLQSDVARQIAAALKAELTEQEVARIDKAPTDNTEAYDFYLRAQDYESQYKWQIAIQMVEQALALDPTFALAHARLSGMHTSVYWYHEDHTQERLALAKAAVDQALDLDPDLPEAHFALGQYYYQGQLDYDRALKEFAITLQGLPSHALTWAYIGYVYRRKGDMEKALANLLKAYELDPRSFETASNLGGTYHLMRNYPAAERYHTRGITLAPEMFYSYFWKAELFLAAAGDVSKARSVVDEALQLGAASPPERPGGIPFLRARLNFLEGDHRLALEQLAPAPALLLDDQFYYLSRAQMSAQIYERMGQGELARTAYDSARVMIEARLREDPADSRYHSALGLVYAGLGRKEEAVQAGQRGVELLPISKEAFRGYARELDLAKIYVMVGEHDQAMVRIAYLLSIPGTLSVPLLRLEPEWEPLRQHPRFQAMAARYGRDL
ncbi:MAG: tetratricopeptide repeat protein, partial [Candidatus Neomarinimicrobiota bacterium]